MTHVRSDAREVLLGVNDRHQEGRVGPWRLHFKVIEEEPAKLDHLRSMMHGHGRYTPAGRWLGLLHDRRGVVMSAVPDEIYDHAHFYYYAKRHGGRILINGLGLGMILHGCLACPNVEHIDVVEIDSDVLELVTPGFQKEIDEGRVTIHNADAYEKCRQWPVGTRWTAAWHDIWDTISDDNLPLMAKLNRSYARRVNHQECWSQEQVRAMRDRYTFYG